MSRAARLKQPPYCHCHSAREEAESHKESHHEIDTRHADSEIGGRAQTRILDRSRWPFVETLRVHLASLPV